MSKGEVEEYGKVRVYRKNNKKKVVVPEKEMNHPLHEPYSRPNRGVLRHSLMIDGLGEEDESTEQDS